MIGRTKTPHYAIFPEVQPHALILNLALTSTFHQLEEQDVNQSLENLGLLKLGLYWQGNLILGNVSHIQ